MTIIWSAADETDLDGNRSAEFPPLLTDVADEGSEVDERGDLHLARSDDDISDPELLAIHLVTEGGTR